MLGDSIAQRVKTMNEVDKKTILHLIADEQKHADKLPESEMGMLGYNKFLVARNTLRDLAIGFEHMDEEIATSLHKLIDTITLA